MSLEKRLRGALAGLTALGVVAGAKPVEAQQNKAPTATEMADQMARARLELLELAQKEQERREAKPYRDALDAQKRIFKQRGNNRPRASEYQEALARKFNITDWASEDGRRIMRYLNDWYNEN